MDGKHDIAIPPIVDLRPCAHRTTVASPPPALSCHRWGKSPSAASNGAKRLSPKITCNSLDHWSVQNPSHSTRLVGCIRIPLLLNHTQFLCWVLYHPGTNHQPTELAATAHFFISFQWFSPWPPVAKARSGWSHSSAHRLQPHGLELKWREPHPNLMVILVSHGLSSSTWFYSQKLAVNLNLKETHIHLYHIQKIGSLRMKGKWTWESQFSKQILPMAQSSCKLLGSGPLDDCQNVVWQTEAPHAKRLGDDHPKCYPRCHL